MISIAMTTYNGEKFVKEQIDSILNQTFTDFELIICDDVSSDSTGLILKDFEKKDKRIKVFFNKDNLGFKKNFEKAISLCKGDYIALADQDDIWTPNHLQTLYENIKEYDLVCGNQAIMNGDGSLTGTLVHTPYKNSFFFNNNKGLYKTLCNGGFLQGASMLLTKGFLYKPGVLPIPENIRFHDLWFTICAFNYSGLNFTYDVITNFRRHGNNSSEYPLKKTNKLITLMKRVFIPAKADIQMLDYIKAFEANLHTTDETNEIVKDCINYIQGMNKNRFSKERIKALKIFSVNYNFIFFVQKKYGYLKNLIKKL